MALWRIPVSFVRRFFIKRRLTFAFVFSSVLFLGYHLTFGRFISVPDKRSTNIVCDCPDATKQQTQNTTLKPQTEVTVTSTAREFTGVRKLEYDSTKSTGSLNVHMWSGICGMNVDILRNWPHFPYFPDKRSFISEFRTTQVLNTKDNGERIFGFVHPQVSGMYKFAITSDDTSELWLSNNEDPASSKMIARVYSAHGSAWTVEGDYKKYPDQISREILLHAGKKYYIESLSKQGSGAAHVAVYWSYYGNATFEIISSKYLSSFYESDNQELIPPHAGKQSNITLQSKSNSYYFHRLPYISRKEYSDLIPTCSYNPSFLVRGKLNRYQGIGRTQTSRVFPPDDTDMYKNISWKHDWKKPNNFIEKARVESVVDKLMNCLRSR